MSTYIVATYCKLCLIIFVVYDEHVKSNACNSGTTMFVCDPTNANSLCVSTSKYMDCHIDCPNGKDEVKYYAKIQSLTCVINYLMSPVSSDQV